MARPIWNGTISFGLLNVPCSSIPASAASICISACSTAATSRRCATSASTETGEEVPWKEIVKGFEYSKGSYVVIDEKRSARPRPSTESVEIEAFCNRDEIDPMYFEKPYYRCPPRRPRKVTCCCAKCSPRPTRSASRGDPHAPVPGGTLAARRRADGRPDALPAGRSCSRRSSTCRRATARAIASRRRSCRWRLSSSSR